MYIHDLLNEFNKININHGDVNYSDEQLVIADTLVGNNNVIVDAVAGSGKTTTINCIVEKLYYKRVLTILYSRFLTMETQSRIKRDNVDVNTIHGFCQKEYGINCNDNNGIMKIVKNNMQYLGDSYDMIIVDEAQDLTPLLSRVIIKIIHDCGARNLIFLGDYKQCIFKFNGADERFLTEADRIFTGNNKCIKYKNENPWVRLKLSETYRCSSSISNFINKCVLKEDRLISNRECSGKPIYISANSFDVSNDIYVMIKDYIEEGNNYDDIAILSFSIENDSGKETPVKKLVNILSLNYNIPIYRPNNDNRELNDEDLLKGKIVVSTFHQMKGRQRKMVIIFGFDNSYYYFDDLSNPTPKEKEENRKNCPNVLYVALTRARDKLILVQDYKKGCLPFIDKELLHEYADVSGIVSDELNINKLIVDSNENIVDIDIGKLGLDVNGVKEDIRVVSYSVTNLIKYLPDKIMEEFMDMFTVNVVHGVNFNIDLKHKVFFGPYAEDVSSIYGTCIPLMKQYRLQGNYIVYESLKNLSDEANELKIRGRYNKLIDDIEGSPDKDMAILKKLPYIINMHNCIYDRYIYPLNQIKHYNWFFDERSLNSIESAVDKLCFLSDNDTFEKTIKCNGELITDSNIKVNYTVYGSLDCVNNRYGPIEFKFVSMISNYHKIQVLIYICMIYLQNNMNVKYNLYNIKTGEMLEINLLNPKVNAKAVMEKLIRNKFDRKSANYNFDDLLKETYN